MDQKTQESDTEIFKRLRKPIDELVDKHCINQPIYNKIRLKQVPWQALDILVNTENIGSLENNPNFKMLVMDAKRIGATDEFIAESVNLAGKIYHALKENYPSVYNRYKKMF